MSGITGILNLDGAPVDPGLLTRMTEFMTFRGPDASAFANPAGKLFAAPIVVELSRCPVPLQV